MIKRISSCMGDEVILSARQSQLYMLTYDNKGGKCKDFDRCPAAETSTNVSFNRSAHSFGAIGLNTHRLKRALYKQTGPLTLSVQDGDSPVIFDIENSGIRTVLMPLAPAFNRTSI